jgi:hypothetical protein
MKREDARAKVTEQFGVDVFFTLRPYAFQKVFAHEMLQSPLVQVGWTNINNRRVREIDFMALLSGVYFFLERRALYSFISTGVGALHAASAEAESAFEAESIRENVREVWIMRALERAMRLG